jgi:hypothetical protein
MTGEDGVETDIDAAATFAAASILYLGRMHLRPLVWGHHRLVELMAEPATELNHDALGLSACSAP